MSMPRDHDAKLLDELFRAILDELMSGRLRADGLVEAQSHRDQSP